MLSTLCGYQGKLSSSIYEMLLFDNNKHCRLLNLLGILPRLIKSLFDKSIT